MGQFNPPAVVEPDVTMPAKLPGGAFFNSKTFRTLEFYLLVIGWITPWAVVAVSGMDGFYAVIGNAAWTAVYAFARARAKQNNDVADFWRTTEFWVTVLGSVITGVTAIQESFDPQLWLLLQGVMAGVLKFANGERKAPELASGLATVQEIVGETTDDLNVVDDVDDLPPDGNDLDAARKGI